MASVTLNFKVPEDLVERIKSHASKKNISMASMIRLILSEYFENLDVQKK